MSATLLATSSIAASSSARTRPRPSAARLAGWVLGGVMAAALASGAAMALARVPEAVQGTVQLGFAPHHMPVLAVIELACLALYLVPRTAVLGAVLLTGYFGGAVATHLRLDQPLLAQTLVPVYAATLLWLGLYLRDARVRTLTRTMLGARR